MKNHTKVIGVLMLLTGLAGCSSGLLLGPLAGDNDAEVLYAEDFNSYEDGSFPSSDWWVEGAEDVYVKDGRLVIKADPDQKRGPGHTATVWNKKHFSGDVKVEYDTRVLASLGAANNLNWFLHYSYPDPDSTLYGTREGRADADYNYYKDLDGYIFTNVTADEQNSARYRMRRVPGFELITENYAYRNRKGETYHITITKRGNKLTYAVDGTTYLEATDDRDSIPSGGYMGARTYQTDLWIDNLKVTRFSDSDS